MTKAKSTRRSLDSPAIKGYIKTDAQGVEKVDVTLMMTDLIACCKIAGHNEFAVHTAISELWPKIEVFPPKKKTETEREPTNGQ
jgi:hypothetical protein